MSLALVDDLRGLQQQKVSLQKRKLAWIQSHRIYYYLPYCNICGKVCKKPFEHLNSLDAPQRAFHASKAKIRLLVGTNRSGKTDSSAVDDVSFWLGFRPWILPDDLKLLPIEELINNYNYLPEECKTKGGQCSKQIIIVADWDVADDIWTQGTDDSAGKLKTYIPKGAIAKVEKNNMGNICAYWSITGALLALDTQKSFINDPQSFEGSQNDRAHYDEPPDRRLRIAISRGLVDKNGEEVFSFTPLTEPWIKNELVDKAADPKNQIEVFHLNAEKNPYISKEGWHAWVATLNEDEKAARARGEWVHLKGLIYKEFIPKPATEGGHLVNPLDPEWIRNNCVVDIALDPHPRNPHAVLFFATAKDGRQFVFDELYSDTFLPDLCALWKVKEQYVKLEAGVKVVYQLPVLNRISDPLAFDEDPEDGRKWADAFSDEGIYLDKASKRKEAGITATREAFKARNLFICTNCTRTIFEIQNYTWDEWKYGSDRNQKEKPKDKDDHMMENLYRLILLESVYVDLQTSSRPLKLKEIA